MVKDITEIALAKRCINFYITSGGRIWGVADEEKINGEPQKRRDVMGNSFSTIEEACYTKSQIEAWARLKKYVERKMTFRNNCPVIELIFHLPDKESARFDHDIMLLADQYRRKDGHDHKNYETF